MSSSSSVGTHPNADKNAQFTGYAAFKPHSDLQVWSYNPPKLEGEFVEIQIECCGICGSDIHTIDSGWGPTKYPCIVGHEIVGKIVGVGDAVKDLKVGDRVGVGAQAGSCLNKTGNCYECGTGNENHCQVGVYTYNGKYPDGQQSQGGYADRVRVPNQFAFKLPDSIPSDKAAPLMCAGATVYSPLARWEVKGKKVGIVGVGGLGHLAVQFANKLGAEVTAISHSTNKKEDATKLGAHHFLSTSDKDAMKAAFRSLDMVLLTANYQGMDFTQYINLVKFDGTFVVVGVPEEDYKIPPFTLLTSRVKFVTSLIGSIKEIKEMLAFAAKHEVYPWVEKFPMSKANEGVQWVRDGKVRYRVVLENEIAEPIKKLA